MSIWSVERPYKTMWDFWYFTDQTISAGWSGVAQALKYLTDHTWWTSIHSWSAHDLTFPKVERTDQRQIHVWLQSPVWDCIRSSVIDQMRDWTTSYDSVYLIKLKRRRGIQKSKSKQSSSYKNTVKAINPNTAPENTVSHRIGPETDIRDPRDRNKVPELEKI